MPRKQQDAEVARLAAKADQILAELDVVVRQMSEMLRERRQTDEPDPLTSTTEA